MKRKKDASGLFFSAFMITAFVICSYFFVGLIEGATAIDETAKLAIKLALFVIFGLLLFYATRIGDGKQVKRFSPAVLVLLDIPAIYIILANFLSFLPLSQLISSTSEMGILACMALGYGIPYTFLAGYELERDEEEKAEEEEQSEQEEEAEETVEQETTDESDDEEEPQRDEEAAY